MAKDTKGKEMGNGAINMHKALKMGHAVETGAGKGPMGGKNAPSCKP
jgi:hypothetical protein